MLLHLVNSGSVPILEDDYDDDYHRPLQVSVSAGTQLLTADLVSKQPASVDMSLRLAENALTLAPTLLNPEDALAIQLVDKSGSPVGVVGRIAGVKRIRYAPSRLSWYRAGMILGAAEELIWRTTGKVLRPSERHVPAPAQ